MFATIIKIITDSLFGDWTNQLVVPALAITLTNRVDNSSSAKYVAAHWVQKRLNTCKEGEFSETSETQTFHQPLTNMSSLWCLSDTSCSGACFLLSSLSGSTSLAQLWVTMTKHSQDWKHTCTSIHWFQKGQKSPNLILIYSWKVEAQHNQIFCWVNANEWYKLHERSMWTPEHYTLTRDCWTSHSKTTGISVLLQQAPLCWEDFPPGVWASAAGDPLPFRHQSTAEVQRWCWLRSPRSSQRCSMGLRSSQAPPPPPPPPNWEHARGPVSCWNSWSKLPDVYLLIVGCDINITEGLNP